MKGLEYVMEKFGTSNSKLAKEFDFDRSNITVWLNGSRPIPKKHLSRLAIKFNIPEEYLVNEVDEIRKLEIDNVMLKNENEYIQFEDTLTDEKGDVLTIGHEKLVNDSTESIELNKANISYLKSIKELQTATSSEHNEGVGEVISSLDENTKLISLFAEIMRSQKVNKSQMKKIFNAIIIYTRERAGIGKLYDYEEDKFVMQLVKLFEKQEEIQKKEAELWGD